MTVIKILGTGCPKCKKLKQRVRQIVEKFDCPVEIQDVTDINEMLSYGYMMTPGLVINEKLVSFGSVPSEEVIEKWIQEEL